METDDLARSISEAASLVGATAEQYLSDPIVVHLVALGILHGEKNGLELGRDRAVEVIRDEVLRAVNTMEGR